MSLDGMTAETSRIWTILKKFTSVCRLTPSKRHWLPTREAWIKDHLKDKPNNLVIRFSAPMVNQRAPASWPNSSEVVTAGATCPAANKTTNVETAGHAGTVTLKLLNMVNIDMWRHPKYYKELRKRNKLDQAISDEASTRGPSKRASWSGPQASSAKRIKQQATSVKPFGQRLKRQATSLKRQDP